jgi:hypothetical protein
MELITTIIDTVTGWIGGVIDQIWNSLFPPRDCSAWQHPADYYHSQGYPWGEYPDGSPIPDGITCTSPDHWTDPDSNRDTNL